MKCHQHLKPRGAAQPSISLVVDGRFLEVSEKSSYLAWVNFALVDDRAYIVAELVEDLWLTLFEVLHLVVIYDQVSHAVFHFSEYFC